MLSNHEIVEILKGSDAVRETFFSDLINRLADGETLGPTEVLALKTIKNDILDAEQTSEGSIIVDMTAELFGRSKMFDDLDTIKGDPPKDPDPPPDPDPTPADPETP